MKRSKNRAQYGQNMMFSEGTRRYRRMCTRLTYMASIYVLDLEVLCLHVTVTRRAL